MSKEISRREFLRLIGTVAAGAGLAACGQVPKETTASGNLEAQTPTGVGTFPVEPVTNTPVPSATFSPVLPNTVTPQEASATNTPKLTEAPIPTVPSEFGEIVAVEDYKGSTYGLDPDNLARVVYDREKGEWVKYERPVRIAARSPFKEIIPENLIEDIKREIPNGQVVRLKDQEGKDLKWGYIFEVADPEKGNHKEERKSYLREEDYKRAVAADYTGYLVSGYPVGVFQDDKWNSGQKDYQVLFEIPLKYQRLIVPFTVSNSPSRYGQFLNLFLIPESGEIDEAVKVSDNLGEVFGSWEEYRKQTVNHDTRELIHWHELGKALSKPEAKGMQMLFLTSTVNGQTSEYFYKFVNGLKEGLETTEGDISLYFGDFFLPESLYPETQTWKDY